MRETPQSLVRFLLDLDNPQAITLRQSVTLSEIIERAREAAEAEKPSPAAIEKVEESLRAAESQLTLIFPHGFDTRDVSGYHSRDRIEQAFDEIRSALGLDSVRSASL